MIVGNIFRVEQLAICSLLLFIVYLAIFIGWQVKSATLVFWKASNADVENQMKISLHH